MVGTLGSCASCPKTVVSQLPEGSTWIGLFVCLVLGPFTVIFFSYASGVIIPVSHGRWFPIVHVDMISAESCELNVHAQCLQGHWERALSYFTDIRGHEVPDVVPWIDSNTVYSFPGGFPRGLCKSELPGWVLVANPEALEAYQP